MGDNDSDEPQPLSSVEWVRCLNCSTSYLKPAGRTTVTANPGCPDCGYVGWVRVPAVTGDAPPSRSVADRLRRRTG